MPDFQLVADFAPTGDQPAAIDRLADGLAKGLRHQTLLGATGTGKSLVPTEPVLIGREDDRGQISWALESIGSVVDAELASVDVARTADGSEVADPRTAGHGLFVSTIDPVTHEPRIGVVSAVSRHASPPTLWRVTTTDGRSVTVTGDHNFVRLSGAARLELAETHALRPGDALPIPSRTPGKAHHVARLDVARAIDVNSTWAYVRGPTILDRSFDVSARRALANGDRAPFSAVGSAGVAVLERFGPTQITAHRGRHNVPASVALDDDWLAFLGLFVAEGHVADRYATITPGPGSIDLARTLLSRIGFAWRERGRDELQLTSRAQAELLRSLCGSRAGGKHLPPSWPDLDDRSVGLLLAGYFEGDGWVENDGAAVCAVTKSKRLANELAYALLRFGIVGRLTRTFKRAYGTEDTGDWYWHIAVRGASDLAAYQQSIGFLGHVKKGRLAQIVGSAVGGNSDVLPGQGSALVRSARQALGMLQRHVGEEAGLSRSAVGLLETGQRAIRRETAQRLLEGFERVAARRSPEERRLAAEPIDQLRRLLACRWATVESVEEVSTTVEHVYDLSVEGTETFLAGFGGLIVHNTFTIAQTIVRHNKPTLVLAHNKTLAAQLYAEFRDFFPNNAVEYFVSYFDYYQPEAYLPRSDTYIEKDSSRNDEIDKLRHAATHALFERRDVIIVASVSCIYGLGAPVDYGATVLRLRVGGQYRRDAVLRHLVDLQYQRNDAAIQRARFRVRGDTLELQPASEDRLIRVEFFGDVVERITELDPLTGELYAERQEVNVYPATHFVTPGDKLGEALVDIEAEMEERVTGMEAEGRVLEAARLRQRTTFDLEMMRELGYCSGVENYSRHLSRRAPGSRPWTLLDYFPPDWLLVVDESHMSIPQVVGMYKNDRTRKEILVDFGFRLPSALDNRPLTFEEFEATVRQAIYMSATPGPYELERSQQIVQQLIRPTGVVDPRITVRPTDGQIDDLLEEIRLRVERGERALVTTLTKKMAEDLADYLHELGIKVQYLHSEVDTLERVQILRDLRLGVFDVLVGINLLREGIDLPEVTLVAILDADKEGFLRSAWSLIQMIGRAARNTAGEVVMYADTITESMRAAIDETDRRRVVQTEYNTAHGIEPTTIVREIHDINERLRAVAESTEVYRPGSAARAPAELAAWSRAQVERVVAQMEAEMKSAAKQLEFERAAALRDEIHTIRLRVLEDDASLLVGKAAEGAAKPVTATSPEAPVGVTPGDGPAPAPRQRPGHRAAGGRGRGASRPSPIEITSVAVLPAAEEPLDPLAGVEGVAADEMDEGTASDWLPGIRDEHDEDSGWQARWLDRPTWDRTVTPNVVKRTGSRPTRRRR